MRLMSNTWIVVYANCLVWKEPRTWDRMIWIWIPAFPVFICVWLGKSHSFSLYLRWSIWMMIHIQDRWTHVNPRFWAGVTCSAFSSWWCHMLVLITLFTIGEVGPSPKVKETLFISIEYEWVPPTGTLKIILLKCHFFFCYKSHFAHALFDKLMWLSIH